MQVRSCGREAPFSLVPSPSKFAPFWLMNCSRPGQPHSQSEYRNCKRSRSQIAMAVVVCNRVSSSLGVVANWIWQVAVG